MWHTILIAAHAGAGGIALLVGCVTITRRALFGIYFGALIAMEVFLLLAIATQWTATDTPARILFSAFALLGLLMVWRATPGPAHAPGSRLRRTRRVHPRRLVRRVRRDPRAQRRRTGLAGGRLGRPDRGGWAFRAPRRPPATREHRVVSAGQELRQVANQRGQHRVVLVPSPVQVGDLRAHPRVVNPRARASAARGVPHARPCTRSPR